MTAVTSPTGKYVYDCSSIEKANVTFHRKRSADIADSRKYQICDLHRIETEKKEVRVASECNSVRPVVDSL